MFKRTVRLLEADSRDDGAARPTFLKNRDLLPVPVEERKWGVVNFVTFWVADSANVVRCLSSFSAS
jgi:NCS1 family nucleobase:cation symporter-1